MSIDNVKSNSNTLSNRGCHSWLNCVFVDTLCSLLNLSSYTMLMQYLADANDCKKKRYFV